MNPQLTGKELYKTLVKDDRVIYNGSVYTVLSVQTSYNFDDKDANGKPIIFTWGIELRTQDQNKIKSGYGYLYLKLEPNDPTLKFINALLPYVEPTNDESPAVEPTIDNSPMIYAPMPDTSDIDVEVSQDDNTGFTASVQIDHPEFSYAYNLSCLWHNGKNHATWIVFRKRPINDRYGFRISQFEYPQDTLQGAIDKALFSIEADIIRLLRMRGHYVSIL